MHILDSSTRLCMGCMLLRWPVRPIGLCFCFFFTFDKISQRSILGNNENMYAFCVYSLLQTECQSFNSYLLEINSEAEQNSLMKESWLFDLFIFYVKMFTLGQIYVSLKWKKNQKTHTKKQNMLSFFVL